MRRRNTGFSTSYQQGRSEAPVPWHVDVLGVADRARVRQCSYLRVAGKSIAKRCAKKPQHYASGAEAVNGERTTTPAIKPKSSAQNTGANQQVGLSFFIGRVVGGCSYRMKCERREKSSTASPNYRNSGDIY